MRRSRSFFLLAFVSVSSLHAQIGTPAAATTASAQGDLHAETCLPT